MTDPGELFLQGYFGQANLKQQQLNRQQEQTNFSAKQALDQQRLAQEAQQHADAMNFEKMRLNQEAQIQQRQQAAQEFSQHQQIQKGIGEGTYEPLGPNQAPPDKLGQNLYASQHPDVTFDPTTGAGVRTLGPTEQGSKAAELTRQTRKDAWQDTMDEYDRLDKANPGMLDPKTRARLPLLATMDAAKYKALFPDDHNLTSDEEYARDRLSPIHNQIASFIQQKYTDPKTGKVDWDSAGKDPKYMGMTKQLDNLFYKAKEAGAMVGPANANMNKSNDNKDYSDYQTLLQQQYKNMAPGAVAKLTPDQVAAISRNVKSQLIAQRMRTPGGQLPDYKVMESADTEAMRGIAKEDKTGRLMELIGGNVAAPTPR